MHIKAAEWRAGKLILTTSDPDAVRFAFQFKGEGDYTLSPTKQKRSLDANAYAWVLIDKLAVATGVPKTEVYRHAILEVGGNAEIIRVQNHSLNSFCRWWHAHGLGWQTELLDSDSPNETNVIVYVGSSEFTKEQMNRLIDGLVQDCKALGIETLPPEKLSLLVENWNG